MTPRKHALIRIGFAFLPFIIFILWSLYTRFLPEDDPVHRSDLGWFFAMLLIYYAFATILFLLSEALYLHAKRKHKFGNIDLTIMIALVAIMFIFLWYA